MPLNNIIGKITSLFTGKKEEIEEEVAKSTSNELKTNVKLEQTTKEELVESEASVDGVQEVLVATDNPVITEQPVLQLENHPTIFHITHWKAGSQWIYAILRDLFPAEQIVPPPLSFQEFLKKPVQQGMVHPTIYLTKNRFDTLNLPNNSYYFVVIRDLRDTLISAYFSFKVSHPVLESSLERTRSILTSVDMEDGLRFLMDEFLPTNAAIQTSWLDSDAPIIKYEDLLEDDVNILQRVLLEHCHLPISPEKLEQAIIKNRFESITQGRKRGEEKIEAHERKGIAGDWQNYFTDDIKAEFKSKFGDTLIRTGYEKDLDW